MRWDENDPRQRPQAYNTHQHARAITIQSIVIVCIVLPLIAGLILYFGR